MEIQKNKDKYGSADRMLLWSNGEGKYAPMGDKNSSKAWNFSEDASREPVYEDQTVSVPETAASARHMNVFSGLLARIGGFFRGLFGSA